MFIVLIDKIKGYIFDPIIGILSFTFAGIEFVGAVEDGTRDPVFEDRSGGMV